MNKKLIRLTEGDLHRIVKGSVYKVLREDAEGITPSLQNIIKQLVSIHNFIEQETESLYGNGTHDADGIAEYCLNRAGESVHSAKWYLESLLEHYNGNDERFNDEFDDYFSDEFSDE